VSNHLGTVLLGYRPAVIGRTVVDNDQLEWLSDGLVPESREASLEALGSVQSANDNRDRRASRICRLAIHLACLPSNLAGHGKGVSRRRTLATKRAKVRERPVDAAPNAVATSNCSLLHPNDRLWPAAVVER
jgi:hypothetical protein